MYIGRFAPSPTGPLHFGSLLAAVASYLDARHHQGRWLLRIDDLDPPREQAGATNDILQTLDAFGFAWDGSVMYQSQRIEAYQEALQSLQDKTLLYACRCSRKSLVQTAAQGVYGPIYPGTCRDAQHQLDKAAIRVTTHDQAIVLSDLIQGRYKQHINSDIGDFIVKRRDGLFAYHLAVVIDDAELQISHIVRGIDLLDSTPRQIYLQQLLGLNTPCYAHFPVAINGQGQKLSKQHGAQALSKQNKTQQLWQALQFLGQQPPVELENSSLQELWQWAEVNWSLHTIPKSKEIASPIA